MNAQAEKSMQIFVGRQILTGNSLSTRPLGQHGSITEGYIWTPTCIVEAYVVASDTPYGHLRTNFNGRFYQLSLSDKPSHKALVRRAHAMMRQALLDIPEETYPTL